MKVLVADSSANPDIASISEVSSRLVKGPQMQVWFSLGCEGTIKCAHWFRPRLILFTDEPRGRRSEELIAKLQGIVPGVWILYLDCRRIFVHLSSFMDAVARSREEAKEDGAREIGNRRLLVKPIPVKVPGDVGADHRTFKKAAH
jgi:hypothetical protein